MESYPRTLALHVDILNVHVHRGRSFKRVKLTRPDLSENAIHAEPDGSISFRVATLTLFDVQFIVNDRGDTQLINKLFDQQHTSMRTEAVGTSDDIEKTYPTE